MSVPPTSSISITQPPIPVGSTSESMLLAAQVMTSSSIDSTSTVSSASAETLLAILERPGTSLSQSVDVLYSHGDTRLIGDNSQWSIRRLPLGPLFIFVTLLLSLLTLPLHSTTVEPPSSHETPALFGTQYVSPVSGHSPGPSVLSPQLPTHHTNRPNLYNMNIHDVYSMMITSGVAADNQRSRCSHRRCNDCAVYLSRHKCIVYFLAFVLRWALTQLL